MRRRWYRHRYRRPWLQRNDIAWLRPPDKFGKISAQTNWLADALRQILCADTFILVFTLFAGKSTISMKLNHKRTMCNATSWFRWANHRSISKSTNSMDLEYEHQMTVRTVVWPYRIMAQFIWHLSIQMPPKMAYASLPRPIFDSKMKLMQLQGIFDILKIDRKRLRFTHCSSGTNINTGNIIRMRTIRTLLQMKTLKLN